MFWKRKKKTKDIKYPIILGMVMLEGKETIDSLQITEDLESNYDLKICNISGNNETLVLSLEQEKIAIAFMPVPIPATDILAVSGYAYNWPNAVADTKSHQSHLIVTAMQSTANPVKRHILFSQVVCSVLRTTRAMGVYLGSQSLLIPKADFLDEMKLLSTDYLPINLWVYFGLQSRQNKQSAYTYGLTAFGKMEMEIIDSDKDLEQLRELMFNISHYVIENNITFEDQQTIGMSAEEKIRISISEGVFVNGNSYKFEY